MPYNFYAETSFTEMCGHGYFGIHICLRAQKYCLRLRLQLSNDRRPWMVGIQSHQQLCQQCMVFCHGLKT